MGIVAQHVVCGPRRLCGVVGSRRLPVMLAPVTAARSAARSVAPRCPLPFLPLIYREPGPMPARCPSSSSHPLVSPLPPTRPGRALPSLLTLVAAAALLGSPAAHAQGGAAPAAPAAASAPAPEAGLRVVRKEVNDPLDAARALFREEKFDAAAARLADADAVPNLTPFERVSLERTRAAIALRQGKFGVSAKALEAALATGEVPPADQLDLMASIVDLALRDKDYTRSLGWAQRYAEQGGKDDRVQLMRLEALRFSGDERGALQGWKARREAAARAGAAMPESHWRVLWALQRRHEPAEARGTLEALARAYPRPEYFAELAAAASQAPELSERGLVGLYRLLRVTNALSNPAMALEMAERVLRIGYPGEAAAVLADAQKAGVLPGDQAAEYARVREAVQRAQASDERERAANEAAARQASDGTRLVDLGWSAVGGLPAGAPAEQVQPGLVLLEQGIAKGGLRRESEARLNLAIAQLVAGRREDAQRTLEALGKQLEAAGKPDQMASAVRLWSLYVAVPAMLPPRN